jgi:Skp family chaperone for outer membrane proteins
MKKCIFTVTWSALLCVVVFSLSAAVDTQPATSDRTKWKKSLEEFNKRREKKLEELKKEQAGADAQAGRKHGAQKQIEAEQKQPSEKKQVLEEQQQEMKELKDSNQEKKDTRKEPAP